MALELQPLLYSGTTSEPASPPSAGGLYTEIEPIKYSVVNAVEERMNVPLEYGGEEGIWRTV